MWQNNDGPFYFIAVFTYLIHWLCTHYWHSFTKLCIICMVFSTVQCAVSWDGECCRAAGFLWVPACKIGTLTVKHYTTRYCRVVIISTKQSYQHDYTKTTDWIPVKFGEMRYECRKKQLMTGVFLSLLNIARKGNFNIFINVITINKWGGGGWKITTPPIRRRQGHKIKRGNKRQQGKRNMRGPNKTNDIFTVNELYKYSHNNVPVDLMTLITGCKLIKLYTHQCT